MDNMDIPLPPSPKYSPSQVTSPQTDEDELYDPLPDSSHSKPARVQPFSLMRQMSPGKTVLGKDKAKQRLKAFKASKSISFGLPRINQKLKPPSLFALNDEEEEEPRSEDSGKGGHDKHSASKSSKQPDPAKSVTPSKNDSRSSDSRHADKSIKHIASTITGVDSMGFVTGTANTKSTKERRGRSRSRDRGSSRKQKSLVEKFGFTEAPKTWGDFTSKNVCVCGSYFSDLKKELSRKLPSSDVGSKPRKNVAYAQGLPHAYLVECIEALRQFRGKGSLDKKDDDMVEIEFPKKEVKETRTRPSLEWSQNPKFALTVCQTREEVMKNNSKETNDALLEIMESHQPSKFALKKEDRQQIYDDDSIPAVVRAKLLPWYVRQNSFLDPKAKPAVFTNQMAYILQHPEELDWPEQALRRKEAKKLEDKMFEKDKERAKEKEQHKEERARAKKEKEMEEEKALLDEVDKFVAASQCLQEITKKKKKKKKSKKVETLQDEENLEEHDPSKKVVEKKKKKAKKNQEKENDGLEKSKKKRKKERKQEVQQDIEGDGNETDVQDEIIDLLQPTESQQGVQQQDRLTKLTSKLLGIAGYLEGDRKRVAEEEPEEHHGGSPVKRGRMHRRRDDEAQQQRSPERQVAALTDDRSLKGLGRESSPSRHAVTHDRSPLKVRDREKHRRSRSPISKNLREKPSGESHGREKSPRESSRSHRSKNRGGPRTPSPPPKQRAYHDSAKSKGPRTPSPNNCGSPSPRREPRRDLGQLGDDDFERKRWRHQQHDHLPSQEPHSGRDHCRSPPADRQQRVIGYSPTREGQRRRGVSPPHSPEGSGRHVNRPGGGSHRSPPPGVSRRGHSPTFSPGRTRRRPASPPHRRSPSPQRLRSLASPHYSPGGKFSRGCSPPRTYRKSLSPSPPSSTKRLLSRPLSPPGGLSPPPRSRDERRWTPPEHDRFRHPMSPGRSSRTSRGFSGGSSRPRDEYYYRHGRDGSYHIPDSTISDVDLIASHRAIPYPPDPALIAATNAAARYHGSTDTMSPKRLSLDERLEKELGIKVREEQQQKQQQLRPDYSRPPPGYLPSGHRLAPTSQEPAAPHNHLSPHQQGQRPPPQHLASSYSLQAPQVPAVPLVSLPTDPPEEGRLVRIGNMLQIVPGDEPSKSSARVQQSLRSDSKTVVSAVQQPPPVVPVPPPSAVRASSPTASLVPKESAKEESTAQALMKKMEEMKRKSQKRDIERKQERRKLFAERLRQQQSELPEKGFVGEDGIEEGGVEGLAVVTGERILETIEKEEEDMEAKLLQEAITLVPEADDEDFLEGASVNPQELPLSALRKHRRTDKVHYISLKPFSKKERKRQQRMAAEEAAAAAAMGMADEDAEEEKEEEFQPRSPVLLPDASTCKPILVFALTQKKSKKVLRYADGVLPGEGSPDNSESADSDGSVTPTQQSETRPKKRKRLFVKIIRTRRVDDSSSSSDDSDEPPPGPPPGSPPLWHTADFIAKFAYQKPSSVVEDATVDAAVF